LPELKLAGVHLVVVPFSEKRQLLERWASVVGGFTAVDFDCSLAPLLPRGPQERRRVLIEGKSVLPALVDIYSSTRSDDPILVNSLGTLQAMARVSGGERKWSRLFFRYIVQMTVACKARAGSTLFVLNSFRDGGVRDVLGPRWVKLCTGAFDGCWILSANGLSRIS